METFQDLIKVIRINHMSNLIDFSKFYFDNKLKSEFQLFKSKLN